MVNQNLNSLLKLKEKKKAKLYIAIHKCYISIVIFK